MWGQAAVNTVLWSEDFSGYSANAQPSGNITNSHTGTVVYGGVTLTYAYTNSNTKVYTSGGPNGNNNILIAKNNGTFSASGISTGGATELTISYNTSGKGTLNVSSSTTNVSISGSTITTGGATTINLTFTNTATGDNLRLDDIELKVKTAGVSSSAEVPSFNPAGGRYFTTQNVTLNSTGANSIYYTTNGTAPTSSSTQYTSAIPVSSTTTIKAVAYDSSNNPTDVATAKYEIIPTITSFPYSKALTGGNYDGFYTDSEVWSWDNTYGAVATKNGNEDALLISPVFSLEEGKTYAVSFQHAGRYTGTRQDVAKLLIKKTSDTDWTELTINNYYTNNNWDFVTNVTDIPSGFVGQSVQIAFKYLNANNNNSAKWEVKNFQLVETVDAGLAYANATQSATYGEAFTKPTLTNPNNLTVTYASSAPAVATVDATGAVTLLKSGETTITASYDGSTLSYKPGSASYTLTVNKGAAGIAYATAAYNIQCGEAFTAQALTNPNNLTVTYSSSNENTNFILLDEEKGDVVLGNIVGSTTITASFAGNEQYNSATASYNINVTQGPAGLSYATASYSVSYDERGSFTAQALTNPNNLTVTYSSSNNDEDFIVVGENDGSVLLGDKLGSATITATFAGNANFAAGSASYLIEVVKSEAGLAYATSTLEGNALETINGLALTNPNSLAVTYTSSDLSVATVDGTGKLTLLKGGTTTITATTTGDNFHNGGTASYTLTVNRLDANLAFDETAFETDINAAFTAPTLTKPAGLAVEYASSNSSVASVNAETGTVTIGSVAGTATITVSSAQTDIYNADEASYTITVYDPDVKGTKRYPYTVAEALAFIDGFNAESNLVTAISSTDLVSKKEYYTRGFVSHVGNIDSGTTITQDGSLYYYISDDGTTSNHFEVWLGKSLNSDNFTNSNILQEGDEVIVCGKLEKYGSTPYYYDYSCLTYFKRRLMPNLAFGGESEKTVTLTKGEELTGVAFTKAEGINLSDITFTSSYNDVASVSNTGVITLGGSTGTSIITATFALTDDYNAGKATCTITVNPAGGVVVEPSVGGYYEKVTSTSSLIDGGKYLIVNETASKALGGQSSTYRTSVSVSISSNTITDKGDATIITLVQSGDNWKLKFDNEKFYTTSAYKSMSEGDTGTDVSISFNNDNVRIVCGSYGYLCYNSSYPRFLNYEKIQSEVQLYKFVPAESPDNITIQVSEAGLATYASNFDLDYSSVVGLEAYKASVTDDAISFTQVNQVPAGAGILLRSTNNGTSFSVPVATGEVAALENNAFIRGTGAAVASEDNGHYNYILNIVNNRLGFYAANGQTVATNRAYLQTTTQSVRGFAIFFDENTGIATLEDNRLNDNAYDMQGRRVSEPKRGLYIINGKKTYIK